MSEQSYDTPRHPAPAVTRRSIEPSVTSETTENSMVVMETARMVIREFVRSDAHELGKILADPLVMEFSSKGPLTDTDTLQYVEWCIGSYQEYGFGQWCLTEKNSGALIGFCGLSHVTIDEADEVQIGYRFAQDQWGLGLASEAVAAVLEHGFDICRIKSIVGIVSPRHGASIRVLAKAGFQSFFETRYSGWDVRVYRLAREERESFNTPLQPPPA